MNQLDLPPEKIVSLEEFKKLPLLTKEDLQDNSDRMLSDDKGRVDHRKTSGSTGSSWKPTW